MKILLGVSGMIVVLIAGVCLVLAAIMAGLRIYKGVRRRSARPLTAEEQWQETSVESLSEDEWSSLLADAPESTDSTPTETRR